MRPQAAKNKVLSKESKADCAGICGKAQIKVYEL